MMCVWAVGGSVQEVSSSHGAHRLSTDPAGPQTSDSPSLPRPDQHHTQVVMQDKLLRMGRNKQFEKRLPTFPVRAAMRR